MKECFKYRNAIFLTVALFNILLKAASQRKDPASCTIDEISKQPIVFCQQPLDGLNFFLHVKRSDNENEVLACACVWAQPTCIEAEGFKVINEPNNTFKSIWIPKHFINALFFCIYGQSRHNCSFQKTSENIEITINNAKSSVSSITKDVSSTLAIAPLTQSHEPELMLALVESRTSLRLLILVSCVSCGCLLIVFFIAAFIVWKYTKGKKNKSREDQVLLGINLESEAPSERTATQDYKKKDKKEDKSTKTDIE